MSKRKFAVIMTIVFTLALLTAALSFWLKVYFHNHVLH
jgi:hypothetical protein